MRCFQHIHFNCAKRRCPWFDFHLSGLLWFQLEMGCKTTLLQPGSRCNCWFSCHVCELSWHNFRSAKFPPLPVPPGFCSGDGGASAVQHAGHPFCLQLRRFLYFGFIIIVPFPKTTFNLREQRWDWFDFHLYGLALVST